MKTKLKFVPIENPILRKKCKRVLLRELKTRELQATIDGLLNFLEEGKKRTGMKLVGFAANQMGISKRIIIIDMAFGQSPDISDIRALVNPKIVWYSETKTTDREMCFTLPNVGGIVKRYKEVKVKTLDRSGNALEIHAKGRLARLLQHEIDHLNGILFIDHLLNPGKAHLVQSDQLGEYRENFRKWKQFTDVSQWVRKVPGET